MANWKTEAQSWSNARIREEIQERRDSIRELEDAIKFHEYRYSMHDRDGFQGNDLYGQINRLNSEIDYLKSLL